MGDDARHFGRQDRGPDSGPIYTRLERERSYGKKREWPGLPERPGLGVRGDGPTPVPTPSFKRGRVEPISPTPREFDRSRPGGFFGGRGAPSGPGTSPNGMGLRRQPAGPPFVPERVRINPFSPVAVDLRPPFGREGCVPPGYGRDARTGATPESPSWRSSDRPGEVIWRGGASASGLSSGTLPPPPPRLGTLGLSLPPGINISSSGDTSVVDTGPGSAEIEAGEIPSDTPAAVTSGAMMPMSWEMKLVSTIGKAPHLQSPFHRTASLPSVHSPSSKVPMGITRKLSESALSLEDDPGSALPMIEIKDPMASDVRLEPRRPQAADHSIRLEPRRPILSPGLSPLRGFSVRLDPRSKTEAVPSSVSEPAPDATTPQGLAAASGNLQTRDCSISTSATPATETKEPEVSRPPKRKRLGWGQGLAARVRQPPTPVSADATEVAEDEAKASQDAPAPTGSADDAVEKTSQEGTAVKKMTIGKEEAVLMETSAAASAAAVDEGAASEGTVAPREVPTEKCPAHKEKSSETGLVPGDSKGEMEEQQPPGDDLPMEEDASQVNLLGSKGVNEEAVLENQRLDTLSTADEAEVKLQDAGAPPGDATVEPSETSATETSANAAPEAEEPQHQVDEGRAEMPLPEAPEPPQGATEVESEASPASADVDADVADLGDVKDAPSPRATPAQEPKSQGISPPATPRSSLLARAGPSPCLAGSPEVRPTASVRADPAPIKPPTKCVASAVCASKPALPLPSSPSMESPSCPLSTAANVSKTVENMESGKPGPVVPSPLPPPSQDTALLDGHQQTAVPTSQQSVLSLPTLPSIQIQTRAACISPVPTVTVVSEAGGAAAEGQQRKKQLKAEMFVRIEDVENDMEAIEKQLAIANTELDTSRERFKAAESEVQALQRGPEVPEISSDESDISSMSEDDDMDTVAAVEAEDEEFESEEKRLTGLLKEIQSNKELRDANMAAEKARHEQSLKAIEQKQQELKYLQESSKKAALPAPKSKRWMHVSAMWDENMRRAAEAEAPLHKLLPAWMLQKPQESLDADPPLHSLDPSAVSKSSCGRAPNPYCNRLNLPPAVKPSEMEICKRNADRFQERADRMRQMLKEKGAKIQGRTLQLLKKYVELRDRHRTAMRSAAVPSSSGKGNSKVNLARAARERAVSSDYAEMQVISQLQAVEQLKTLVKLPNQIIDPSEKRSQILPSDNGLVDDPVADLQLAKLREQWTPAECRIFLEKFQQFPKDFRKIASFLERRSVGDCIQYFYENQKLEAFANYRRKKQIKKRRMYSDASKKKSFLQNQGGPQAQARAREESEKRAREEQKVAKAAKARAERAALRGNFRAEAVAAAFDELIGSGGDDEEPMEQRPSSIKGKDLEKKPKEAAKSKKSKDRARDMAKTVRDASDGPERKPPYVESGRSGEWTDSDQQNFVLAFKEHGRDWKAISAAVKTKSEASCKSYFGKHRRRMGLEDSVSKKKAPTKSMSSGKPDLAVAAPGANGASSQHSDVLAEGQEGSPTQELADIAAETQLLSDERMDDVDDDRPPNIPNTTPSRQPQRPVITTGPRSKRGPAAVKSEEAETKAQGADDKDRGMHDVTAEDLERLRAAPHAGYLQGLPEGMALQLQQMWNRSSRSSSGAPASSAPQAMLASMLQPPGSSGLPPKGSSSQMQQGSGGGSLMGSGGLSGVNPALLQQAVAAGHISVPQLVQMGMVPGMQGLMPSGMFSGGMQAMMMQPGMMQMAALHQLGLLPPGMHPGISCGLLGSGMQGADMGGQHGRDSPEPQQGPQGSSRPPPHNRQSDKKTAALDREGGAGTHEKLFAADLQSYSHMELHRRRQESERGAESNPTDRHNDHHPELGSSACSPEREHVSGEGPPSPRTKDSGIRHAMQQQMAREAMQGYHGSASYSSANGPGSLTSLMVHEAAKARAKHASMENPPTSAALAALIWEHEQAARFAAKMEGSGRGDRQQQGSPSDLQHRGEKSNATKEALIAAMLQQQSLMKGRGPSPPPGAMRGFGAASDIKHARGGVAGSYGKISPSSSRGDVEAPSVRHPGRHDSPGTNSEAGMSETKTSMQQLMQQHAAAQYWASRGGPDSGRRSPSSASALHGHSREDIDRIYRSTREAEAMAAVEEQHRLAAAMHRQRVASATALEELEREAAAAAEHSRRAHMGRVASAGTMSGWGGSGISHKWPSSLPFANTAIQAARGSSRDEMDERHEDMEAHTMESVMQRQNEAFAEAAARQSEALLAAMGRSGHGAPGGMQLPPGVNPFSFNPALASALGLGGGGMHPGMHLGDMPHRRGSPGHGSSPDKK